MTETPRNSVDVWAEMGDRKDNPAGPSKRSRTKRDRPARQGFAPARTRLPDADTETSLLAQAWFDAGEERGFSFPFNVNFLALALAEKISKDPVFAKFRQDEEASAGETRDQQIHRWVAKMVERWWAEYADGTITASNAKDHFLEYDWDDLRYYAHSCLRAAWLTEHGVRQARPEYPDQQKHRGELRRIREESTLTEYWSRVEDAGEEIAEPLGPEGRERLHSFAETRRKK